MVVKVVPYLGLMYLILFGLKFNIIFNISVIFLFGYGRDDDVIRHANMLMRIGCNMRAYHPLNIVNFFLFKKENRLFRYPVNGII